MPSYSAGSAYIQVLPSLRDFNTNLRAQLKDQDNTWDLKVVPKLDDSKLAETREQVQAGVGDDVLLKPKVDDDALAKSIGELSAAVREMSDANRINLRVSIDQRSLDEARAEVASVGSSSGSLGYGGTAAALVGGGAVLGAGAIDAAALGATAAAVAAIGIAAEKDAPQVKAAFSDMEATAKQTLTTAFQPYIPVLVQIAGQAKSTVSDLKPEFTEAAQATAPLLSTLSTGLLNAVRQGVNDTVPVLGELRPATQAAADDFGKLEQGVSGFFKNIDTGQATQSIEVIGTDIEQVLPAVSTLLSTLAPLGNALLSVVGPAFQSTANDISLLRPVLLAVDDVIQPLAPGIGAVVPPVLALLAASKLLTGSWTDFSGAGQKVLGVVQNYDGTLTSLANKIGITTAAQNQEAQAEAIVAVRKAQLVKAAADEAAEQAAVAASAKESAAAQLALADAETAQRVAATELGAAETALAETTDAASFSFGPLGIALGVIGFALSGFLGSAKDTKAEVGDLSQQIIQLGQDTPSAAANLLGGSQQLQQISTQLTGVGSSTQQFARAFSSGTATATSYVNNLSSAQQKLGQTTIGVSTTATQWNQVQNLNHAQSVTTVADLAANTDAYSLLSPQLKTLVDKYNDYNSVLPQAQNALKDLKAEQQAENDVLAANGIQISQNQRFWNSYAQQVASTVSAFNDATGGIKQMTDNLLASDQTFLQAKANFAQLDQAVVQAKQQSTQASQAVTAAQHSEAQAGQAVQNAQLGVENAVQGVATAEQSLRNAQQSELQAQKALTQARADAQAQLESYGRQLADQSTAEDEARLRLVQAQEAVQQAGLAGVTLASLGGPTAANAANYQLLLQQEEAQNNLNDVLAQGAALQQQASAAQAAGVNGSQQVVQAQQQLTQAQQQAQSAAQGLKNAQQQVTQASEAVANAQYSEQQAHLAVQNAMDASSLAAAAYKTAQDNAKRSTDQGTLSGLQNYQMLEQLFEQNLTTTGSVADATLATEEEGKQLGFANDDIQNVINSLTKFPINTTFSVVGTPSLDIQGLVKAAQAAGVDPFSLGLPIQAVNNAVIPPGVGGHAAGGQITGPGTATSDSILARLSNREWVHPVSSVDYYGEPFMAAIQQRTIPREMLPGFASGGQVTPNQLLGVNLRLAAWDAVIEGTRNILTSMGAPNLPDLPAAGPVNLGTFGTPTRAGGGGPVPSVPSSRAANEAIVQSVFSQFGWGSGIEWDDSVKLIMRESGFNNEAQNPTSTAFGIFQFLDSTWRGYGISKTADPATQALGGARYIQTRYHDPVGAWAHETNFGWYDNGGLLPPGYSTVYNGTGRPEPVFTNGQLSDAFAAIADRSGFTNATITGDITVNGLDAHIDGRIHAADQIGGNAILTGTR